MAKGYWIVGVDVTDAEAFKTYQAAVGTPLETFGGRFLVRGGRSHLAEGNWRARGVVIEFPSYQAALDCYNSPAYAEPLAMRLASANCDLLIVEGLEG